MVGETLNDRYRIERRLGGGSQAEVFLATDVHMERLVAIKIWKPEGGFTVDEFLREAKLLARFGAPHFVTIHEHAATLDQRPFFVLEYLQGETLQDLSTPLTAEEVCRCVRDVCVGLQKAHDEGVVHRDLKPSNLMVVDRGLRTERYVILDLGIAKITDTSNWRQTLADATMAGAGTLLYMSPEQCNGNPIDQRTDVYAFGCLLFMLLVQEEPFANKAGSHLSVLNAILSDPPRRLAEVRPDGVFSEGLEQLVQDCLAKKPDERPASMSEVEARFEACAPDNGLLLSTSTSSGRSGPGSSGIRTRRPIGSSTHPNRQPKRRLLTIGLLALVATAASGLAFFFTRPSSEATSSQKTAAQTPLTRTPLTQAVESPNVNGTASPVQTKDPLPNPAVKQASARTTEVRTSRPTEAVATRTTDPHAPIVPPVVKNPVVKPPTPPSTKDDHYFVVRNRTLSADDAFGKSKEQNHYGVLANDGLPSGKSYEAECVEQPRFGPLKFNKDGTFTYACLPQPGENRVHGDTFKYRVRASDKELWSEPASVEIVIRPFSDEENAVIKRIEADYGAASIRNEDHPPAVIVDFAEQRVKKRIRDESLTILDGLGEVLRELQLDSQPITDSALDHLRRFSELRILSLAGTDVSAAGLPKLATLKNLTDVDLSDTLLAESDVAALVAGRGRPAPLRVQRDGPIDRLRNLGVAIAAKNDLALGRNGFVGTIPAVALGDFQKISLSLKKAPRLVGLVVSNPEIGDEWLTDSWVRQLEFLKSLDLRGTLVSPQQIALFGKQFPGVQVQWDPPLVQLRSVGAVTQSADGTIAIDLTGKKVDSRTWTLLSQVDKLATLNLSRVPIDGVGFQRLLQLTGLRALTLQETPLAGKQV
ncbi:MAG TPA: serine/threonine-protein kinase, partial [Planctomycetaceae bacterium]|nr:serine/threonine-protein kinase [Planctomycetaceae bacterium]